MFSRKKQTGDEALPWYRQPEYRGNLTEDQKRELDTLRSRASHPSAQFDDLPEEVQSYIARLETDAYDLRQERVAIFAVLFSLLGLAIFYFRFFGPPQPLTAFWTWVLGLLLLIAPWFVYRREWEKISAQFESSIDERFRQEWEIDYLSRSREDAPQ